VKGEGGCGGVLEGVAKEGRENFEVVAVRTMETMPSSTPWSMPMSGLSMEGDDDMFDAGVDIKLVIP
jgi:hypothetical protein